MSTKFENGNVIAVCPVCGVQSTFESKRDGSNEHGSIIMDNPLNKGWSAVVNNTRVIFRLVRCAGCGRAGLAGVSASGNVNDGTLVEFLPSSVTMIAIPEGVPDGITKEFREAENDASISSYRSASAMLRSVLEKTLRANGYTDEALTKAGKKPDLYNRIELANEDGILTDARKRRAHNEVRVLGNDVMHEDWKEVKEEDYELAHTYTQRILEDFYDSRDEVLAILDSKDRDVKVVTEQEEATENG